MTTISAAFLGLALYHDLTEKLEQSKVFPNYVPWRRGFVDSESLIIMWPYWFVLKKCCVGWYTMVYHGPWYTVISFRYGLLTLWILCNINIKSGQRHRFCTDPRNPWSSTWLRSCRSAIGVKAARKCWSGVLSPTKMEICDQWNSMKFGCQRLQASLNQMLVVIWDLHGDRTWAWQISWLKWVPCGNRVLAMAKSFEPGPCDTIAGIHWLPRYQTCNSLWANELKEGLYN